MIICDVTAQIDWHVLLKEEHIANSSLENATHCTNTLHPISYPLALAGEFVSKF